jgi:hypothetical protein
VSRGGSRAGLVGGLLAALLAACDAPRFLPSAGDAGADSSPGEGDAMADGPPPKDATVDTRPASCPAPLPVVGMPLVCPDLEGGVCGPANYDILIGGVPMSPFVPPTQPDGQCTAAQVTELFAACTGDEATMTTCQSWVNANLICSSCVFSYESDSPSTYGPYYLFPGSVAAFNVAGCILLLDPCQKACAEIIQTLEECEYNSCYVSAGCTTPEALTGCEPSADTCQCAPQARSAAACEKALTGSNSPAAACLDASDMQELVPRFCGSPDAG